MQAKSHPMYVNDQASQLLGIELVAVEAGRAVATMTVRPDMVNGLDVCHGGFLFTLADTAMAFASNTGDGETNPTAFASHADIDFVNPAPLGTVLTAASRVETTRAKLTVHNVVIDAEDGTTIAVFRGRTITTSTGVTSS